VLHRTADGRLVVQRGDGAIARLPVRYVAQHVTLAYASTVHAAQGRTVDTAHAVLGEHAHRADAYVALTRGRTRNTAYLTTLRAPDAHDQERLASNPLAQLAAILGNADTHTAALLQRRLAVRDAASLAWIGTQWDETSKEFARDRYTDTLAHLLPISTLQRALDDPGYPDSSGPSARPNSPATTPPRC
jgi:hypothetical protein